LAAGLLGSTLTMRPLCSASRAPMGENLGAWLFSQMTGRYSVSVLYVVCPAFCLPLALALGSSRTFVFVCSSARFPRKAARSLRRQRGSGMTATQNVPRDLCHDRACAVELLV